MKVSEVIEKLIKLKNSHGDIDVLINYPGYGYDTFEPWQLDYSLDWRKITIG